MHSMSVANYRQLRGARCIANSRACAVPYLQLLPSRPAASTAAAAAPSCGLRATQQRSPRACRVLVVAHAHDLLYLTTAEEEEDFDKLGDAVQEVTGRLVEDLKGCSIYLVGMMGSGKTTVGRMLANTLNYTFFDSDFLIEKSHEPMSCAEIFKEYGQDYFRTAETSAIKELGPYKNLVVATGGGAVIKPMNWSYMQQGIVVWLNGDVHILAKRVTAEGVEKRPLIAEGASAEDAADPVKMLDNTKSKLAALLEDRTKYYVNADIIVPLDGQLGEAEAETGAPTAVVMLRLLRALDAKIKATKAEREERANFTIENADQLKTMRTVQSPAIEGQEDKA